MSSVTELSALPSALNALNILQPRLVKALEDVSGVDGDPLKLVCEFESDDTADCDSIKITWLKDGVEIKPSNDISFNWSAPSASLTIQESLYPDDNGVYVCKARNKHGCVESSSHVTVTGKILLDQRIFGSIELPSFY